ncbi:Aldose 1-epimerase-like [Oopsacas minuta]|uniref:Aldose 1-epimerase-like n=1 Tax=Oopsacas minuta TaxID=111878 RepID=A0AAV7JRJ6_9METZ|nr:Aldose 1-epimerase-like [Oopsacas minuta]
MALHIECKTCDEYLMLWTNGKRKSFKFGVPMLWREQRNHYDNCVFCMVDMKGFNRHKKRMWSYPDLDSARRPVLHFEEVSLPKFSPLPDLSIDCDRIDEDLDICHFSESEFEVALHYRVNSIRKSSMI